MGNNFPMFIVVRFFGWSLVVGIFGRERKRKEDHEATLEFVLKNTLAISERTKPIQANGENSTSLTTTNILNCY